MHVGILLPKARGKGKRRSPQQQRELLNAMFYVVHTGGGNGVNYPMISLAGKLFTGTFGNCAKMGYGRRSIPVFGAACANKPDVIQTPAWLL